MPATDIPSYVQGFRFNSANYAAGEFADLSGYGGPVTDHNGTPTFETVDGHEGVKLDNTWHGQFWHPNAWQGTIIAVLKLEPVGGGTINKRIVVFGADGATGNLQRMNVVFFSGQRRLDIGSYGADSTGIITMPSGIKSAGLAFDQVNRGGYNTSDGVTVTKGSSGTDPNHGNEDALRSNGKGAFIGPLEGDTSNTTADATVNIHLFEMHFFQGNALLDYPTQVEAFMTELDATYGTPPLLPGNPSELASTVDWWVTDQACTISSWTSQAGDLTEFTQAGAGFQPSLANSKNSIDVLTFDGASDVMHTNEGTTGLYPNLPSMRLRAGNNSTFYGRLDSIVGEFSSIVASAVNRSAWGVWEVIFDATANTVTLIKDGTQLGQATDYTGATDAHLFIVAGDLVVTSEYDAMLANRSGFSEGLDLAHSAGANQWLGMKVAEVSVHNQPVTGTDLTDMRSYFATKWAL